MNVGFFKENEIKQNFKHDTEPDDKHRERQKRKDGASEGRERNRGIKERKKGKKREQQHGFWLTKTYLQTPNLLHEVNAKFLLKIFKTNLQKFA